MNEPGWPWRTALALMLAATALLLIAAAVGDRGEDFVDEPVTPQTADEAVVVELP